jgi:FixJ family two-component response regulator
MSECVTPRNVRRDARGMRPKTNALLLSQVIPLASRIYPGDGMGMPAKQMTVAVLDDDLSVRTALGRLLKASKMEVDSYASGLDFFHAVENHSPDCLLLDLQMAGIDGIDVMHYLSQRGFRIPVIVITAHDAPGSRETCLGAGAAAYLRKPFDADELLSTIDMAIAHAIT